MNNNNNNNYYNNQYDDDEMMLPMDSTIATFESNRGHLCGQNNDYDIDGRGLMEPINYYDPVEETRQEEYQQQHHHSPSVRFASSVSRGGGGGEKRDSGSISHPPAEIRGGVDC